MNIEELRLYCLSIRGASESFPFTKFGRGAENILVFKVMNKMFAYVDIYPPDGIFRVWMKNENEQATKLCQEYEGIVRSFRNLEHHWIGVALGADIPDQRIEDLIQFSVKEVVRGLSKKKQQEYIGESS